MNAVQLEKWVSGLNPMSREASGWKYADPLSASRVPSALPHMCEINIVVN